MKKKTLFIKFLCFEIVTAMLIFGCKDKSTEPTVNNLSASEDAAETVAAAVGEDNGGTMDQIGDVSELATSTGIASLSLSEPLLKSNNTEGFTKSYDPITGKWTGTLTRVKGNSTGLYYSSISRSYEWQFLKNGIPQQYYFIGNDTATTISFKILSGTAYAFTPRWRHRVSSLTATWTITNANTPTITINGTSSRSAVDTLTSLNAQRTLSNQLNLTYTNITAQRGNRSTISSTATGTITGTYTAIVTFQRGEQYSEKDITRDISVEFSGGTSKIDIGGKKFFGNLKQGTLN